MSRSGCPVVFFKGDGVSISITLLAESSLYFSQSNLFKSFEFIFQLN
jgi:hypothetical protein